MHKLRSNYLAPWAKRLIPKLARNWRHPDQIPEFRDAFKDFSPDEREKRLSAARRVGWRLSLAFDRTNEVEHFFSGNDADASEYERDWLLYEARHINAGSSGPLVIAMNREDGDDKVNMPWKGNSLDSLLRFVQKHLVTRMAVCHRKDCERRYYFREPGRRGQKYCSARCAEIAIQARANAWWAEHGKKWRAERRRNRGSDAQTVTRKPLQ